MDTVNLFVRIKPLSETFASICVRIKPTSETVASICVSIKPTSETVASISVSIKPMSETKLRQVYQNQGCSGYCINVISIMKPYFKIIVKDVS